MHTVLFSDTHLSSRVYPKKLKYLRSIIQPADRVIILGDFWDGFLTSFDKFVDSEWRELFPLLLERDTMYIYGNHDRQEWCNDRVGLFSTSQHRTVEVTIDGHDLLLAHGDEDIYHKTLDRRFRLLDKSVPLKVGASMDVLHKLVWGNRFLNSDSDINNPARAWSSNQLINGQLLICGHSHFPELDRPSRMANTGFIGCGYGNYLVINDGQIELVKERYWSKSFEV